ncbi:hypothetical protein [Gynuella sunshinyii]|uniref:Uncharacterized protein n=1 Tax=Gynuella sunshinyii YC6258 TaxID=1445510 RepID=A0A0C5VKW7_9GAMM|nr:hypothetical protein [Gynuella sunshinyii]AJQ94951.1 hypothetical Protein YC6258_02913 [Gynuella sunshinyii YC6258]
MNALITVVIFVLLVGLLLTMLVIQNQHKRNMERLKAIQALNTQNKRLKNALRLDALRLLTSDMSRFIYSAMIRNTKQILTLKPDNPAYVKSDLEVLVRDSKATPNARPGSAVIKDPDQIKLVMNQLRSLYNCVKDSLEEKRISAQEAEKLAGQIDQSMINLTITFHHNRINGARSIKNYKEAIAYCQKLLDFLTKNKRRAEYQQEIIEIRQLRKNIHDEWIKHSTEQKQARKKEPQDATDQFADFDQSWQKTNLYE